MNKSPKPITLKTGAQPPSRTLHLIPEYSTYEGGGTPRDGKLKRYTLPDKKSIFGSSLSWRCRWYSVDQPWEDGQKVPPPPLGREPRQPDAPQDHASKGRCLCLFNLIVACEWYPSEAYLRQLRWAFRRASDFLYDVTNGYMAFGQVVCAGPELLDVADIQIMASNRFHPRSWVNGMFDSHKYMPIRVGRGLWHKYGRFTIPWDEPEAYRSLVHEWAHYALGLKDQYLKEQRVKATRSYGPRLARVENKQGAYDYGLAIPQVSLPIESIMARQQGTSELVAHYAEPHMRGKDSEWEELISKDQFQILAKLQIDRSDAGPGELPLPLPVFTSLLPQAPNQEWGGELRIIPPDKDKVNPEHCWVYVIKGGLDHPSYVIAQGTLEYRSAYDGFPLLGAVANDVVVAIDRTSAWCGTIPAAHGDQPRRINWQDTTPRNAGGEAAFPLVDVIPEQGLAPSSPEQRRDQAVAEQYRLPVAVRARVHSRINSPSQVRLFPIGSMPDNVEASDADTATSHPLRRADETLALDGHVLLVWNKQDGAKAVAVSAYSLGGGPDSTPTVKENPTTAGSAEGNAMLFFYDPPKRDPPKRDPSELDYSHVRVVTTLIHGQPDQLPGDSAGSLQARSYTFSLASNVALPDHLCPTLVLFYDSSDDDDQGDLRIYRQTELDRWMPLPTFVQPDAQLVAAPLTPDNAPKLFDASADSVERFRLFWTPRDSVA